MTEYSLRLSLNQPKTFSLTLHQESLCELDDVTRGMKMEHERRELETLPQTYVHKAFHVGPDFRQVGLWGQWLSFFPVSLFKKKN